MLEMLAHRATGGFAIASRQSGHDHRVGETLEHISEGVKEHV